MRDPRNRLTLPDERLHGVVRGWAKFTGYPHPQVLVHEFRRCGRGTAEEIREVSDSYAQATRGALERRCRCAKEHCVRAAVECPRAEREPDRLVPGREGTRPKSEECLGRGGVPKAHVHVSVSVHAMGGGHARQGLVGLNHARGWPSPSRLGPVREKVGRNPTGSTTPEVHRLETHCRPAGDADNPTF